MGLFSFFKLLKIHKAPKPVSGNKEYIPSFWEDDFCQVEIVSSENRDFIEKQVKQIAELAAKSGTEYGFNEIFIRLPLPVPARTIEIRADYLEEKLTGFGFQKAATIQYNGSEILDCRTGKTKAFGFTGFTIFFDTADEFVNNIWAGPGLIESAAELKQIQDMFYSVLGVECEFVLIDWNRLRLYDLADREQVKDCLLEFFK